jgi:hypothetical protein
MTKGELTDGQNENDGDKPGRQTYRHKNTHTNMRTRAHILTKTPSSHRLSHTYEHTHTHTHAYHLRPRTFLEPSQVPSGSCHIFSIFTCSKMPCMGKTCSPVKNTHTTELPTHENPCDARAHTITYLKKKLLSARHRSE